MRLVHVPGRLKSMKVQWKKMIIRASLWLATEIFLGSLGIDDLADYSEFIFERNVIVLNREHSGQNTQAFS